MPNSNYVAGRAFEYRRMKALESSGWKAYRTAGSHGEFDIIAVAPGHGILLIQCKVKATKTGVEAMLQKFRDNPPLPPSESYDQCLDVWVKSERKLYQALA